MKVLGGAGLVGAVDRDDRRAREGGVGVEGLDGVVVPGGDVAVEDLGDDLARHVEVLVPGEAGEVVGDGDRGDVERDLDDIARLGQVVVLEGGVGAGEVHGALEELGDARAGAAAAVLDRGAGVGVHEGVHPRLLGVRLRGRARALDGTGEVAAGGAGARGVGGAAGVGAAGGESGQSGDGERGNGAATGEVHGKPSLWSLMGRCARPAEEPADPAGGSDGREAR